MRQVLLACSILSSLLYAATDLAGGLLYDGYSFTSQTISELGAIGAPSQRLVDRLFMLYSVLALPPIHRRGAGSAASDFPHIVVAGVVVLLMLLALGFGAFALGKRFRRYSFATLLIVIVSSALTVPYMARIAAGQPTPGVGIIERINVYSMLLWLAVFAGALLRRRDTAAHPSAP